MGVAGVGKTSVGEALARALGWGFLDADAFHSKENVAKMARGEALTDVDRAPWLAALHAEIAAHVTSARPTVLACSALAGAYRAVLAGEPEIARHVGFAHLAAPASVIAARLRARAGHYAKAELLDSQLAALEPPLSGVLGAHDAQAIVVDATLPIDDIVATITSWARDR